MWPSGVPTPGSLAWPDAAVRWLYDHVPANRWRHRHLEQNPWLLCVTATVVVRAELEALRAQYRLTASWTTLMPARTHRALLAATAAQGKQAAVLLEEVLALEEALTPLGQRPVALPHLTAQAGPDAEAPTGPAQTGGAR